MHKDASHRLPPYLTIKEIQDYNTKITLDNEMTSVYIILERSSDLMFVYYTIKNLVKWAHYSPISVYAITKKKGVTTKKKKSISMFKHSTIYDLLDMSTSTSSTLLTDSGDAESAKVNQWEIRFMIKVKKEDLDIKIKEVRREFGIKMKELVKNDD